ncbi:DNA methylase [Proteus phage vB_PmiP_RS10pmA]|nr:DNA methylase [Proteus phage vB_PmiP_RS10pmA]
MSVINIECKLGMQLMIADNSIDAIVTDPPYGLSKQPKMEEVLKHWLAGDDYNATGSGFMGKSWDSFVPGPSIWKEAYRCLKPGAWAVVFAGSRTQDLMALSLRLAGFEIMDTGMWLYGSGFPKSLDISKAIDKHGGEYIGWFGEWLKNWRLENNIKQSEISKLFPSKTGGVTGCVANWEKGYNLPTIEQFNLICKHFKLPFENIEDVQRDVIGCKKTNLTAYQNIGGDNISGNINITKPSTDQAKQWEGWGTALKPAYEPFILARKPLDGTYANNVLKHGVGGLNIDGCRVGDEVRINHPAGNKQGGNSYNMSVTGMPSDVEPTEAVGRFPANVIHDGLDEPWAKYFYCAKASKKDRDEGLENLSITSAGEMTYREEGSDGLNSPRSGAGRTTGARNIHPTVKPTELMRYLCRLVTPPDGLILDPFSGSGSTGKGAVLEGFNFIGFEMDDKYCEIANERIKHAHNSRIQS